MQSFLSHSQAPENNTDELRVLGELRPSHSNWKRSTLLMWDYTVLFLGTRSVLQMLASGRGAASEEAGEWVNSGSCWWEIKQDFKNSLSGFVTCLLGKVDQISQSPPLPVCFWWGWAMRDLLGGLLGGDEGNSCFVAHTSCHWPAHSSLWRQAAKGPVSAPVPPRSNSWAWCVFSPVIRSPGSAARVHHPGQRWQEWFEIHLLPCWWECKLVQPLWGTVSRFPQKTKNRAAIWSSNPTPGRISG